MGPGRSAPDVGSYRYSGLSRAASHDARLFPVVGNPPLRRSSAARCMRFHVVKLVFRRVAQVLQRVQDVHGDVLGAVLVTGDDHAADPAVVRVLAGLVELP